MNINTNYENLRKSNDTKKLLINSEIAATIYEIEDKKLSMCYREKGNLVDVPMGKLPGIIKELKGIYDVWEGIK